MLSKLSVTQKGLLLVSIPVLFEFLFAGSLYYLVDRAQQNRERFSESKELLSRTMDLQMTLIRGTMAAFGSDDGIVNEKEVESVRQTLKKARWAFGDGARRRPEMVSALKDAYACCDMIEAWINKAVKIFNDKSIPRNRRFALLREDAYVLAARGRPVLARIIQSESRVQRQAPASQKQDQIKIVLLVVFGLGANATLAIFLARAFGKDFIDRLQLISSNASRLIRDDALVAISPGADEVARLDQSLHNAAAMIHETRRKELAILENAADVICSIDNSFSFVTVGASAMRCWGLGSAELTGQDLRHYLPAKDIPAVERMIRVSRNMPGKKFEVDSGFKGNPSPLNIRWAATCNNDDELVYLTARDVSAAKELDRMRERFVAAINHDIRTPLTSVHGSIELTLAGIGGPLSKTAQVELEQTLVTIDDLTNSINMMLDIEKLRHNDGLNLSSFSMLDACATVQARLPAAMSAVLHFSPGDCMLTFDSERFVRALCSLLTVASEYRRSQGPIHIEWSKLPTAGKIAVSTTWSGEPMSDQLKNLLTADISLALVQVASPLRLALSLKMARLLLGPTSGLSFTETADGRSQFTFEVEEDRSARDRCHNED